VIATESQLHGSTGTTRVARPASSSNRPQDLTVRRTSCRSSTSTVGQVVRIRRSSGCSARRSCSCAVTTRLAAPATATAADQVVEAALDGRLRAVQLPGQLARGQPSVDLQRQVVAAVERQGPGDLAALIGSGATWEVN